MIDSFLKKYIKKYDTWLEQDLIDYSSKVIPVKESLTEQKHIIPSQQAEQILYCADLITLAGCACRSRYENCDKPVDVCFVLNKAGEKWIKNGLSRKIEITEAKKILKKANQSGLVHMTLYQPDHEIFALCSCCSCCCHDLQLVLKYGKSYITSKSDFIAEDDPDNCIHCGECVRRCPFNARTLINKTMIYSAEDCYGCGLCATTCPENAISLVESTD